MELLDLTQSVLDILKNHKWFSTLAALLKITSSDGARLQLSPHLPLLILHILKYPVAILMGVTWYLAVPTYFIFKCLKVFLFCICQPLIYF